MNGERRYYIDNIRWACILMLVPFHCAMAWNSWGEGNYVYFSADKGLSTYIVLMSPWYMPLLFVLAGMSARLSMTKRTYSQFMIERVKKLFIPLITGMVTIVAAMAFFADKYNYGYTGNFIEHYKVYFTKFTELTGYDGGWTPGHLWFMLYLFIVSCACLGIIALQKKKFSQLSFANMKVWVVAAIGIIPMALSQVLNFGGKSIGTYFALFLLGYYVLCEDQVIERIIRYRYIFLVTMIVADIADVYMYIWMDNASDVANTIAMYITMWAGILTVISFSKTRFNQHNKLTAYLSRNSFIFYIFHFLWLVILQYYLSKYTSSKIMLYIVPVAGTFLMTFASVEAVNRIPVVNKLFGAKKW